MSALSQGICLSGYVNREYFTLQCRRAASEVTKEHESKYHECPFSGDLSLRICEPRVLHSSVPSRSDYYRRLIMSLYTAKEIMDIIPHRYPFLLIDSIEELEPGVRAVGRKCVTMNEPYFQGHFPGNPVMPGVLIIEALAQVGAVAILSQPEWKGRTAYFAGIDKAKFRQKVMPGDVLHLETTIYKVKGPVGVGKAVAAVNGKIAAQAELTFAIG